MTPLFAAGKGSVPERDPAKVVALANVVREMATGMRAADVLKALASVITAVVCDTSRNRETAQAIVASLSDEMLIAVNQAERPGWPASRRQ
jgi:hypothetical protein